VSRAHKPKAGFWIRLCVLAIYPFDSVFFKLRWHNLERMPEHGPVLVAVNHISQLDTAAVARLIWQSGRIPRFLIKDGVFAVPVVGRVLTGAGQVPVYRGTSRARESLDAASAALAAGECVIIYPEGTVTKDPDYWPARAKNGIARIALANPDVPVIPIGQWGAQRSFDQRGKIRLRPRRRHEASLGQPVDLSEFHGQALTSSVLSAATAKIMAAVTAELATVRGEQPPSAAR